MSKRFKKPYASEHLDAGVDMIFHPVNGMELRYMCADYSSRCFYYRDSKGGWDMDAQAVVVDRISAGKDVAYGESYPRHWNFDPFTGEELD